MFNLVANTNSARPLNPIDLANAQPYATTGEMMGAYARSGFRMSLSEPVVAEMAIANIAGEHYAQDEEGNDKKRIKALASGQDYGGGIMGFRMPSKEDILPAIKDWKEYEQQYGSVDEEAKKAIDLSEGMSAARVMVNLQRFEDEQRDQAIRNNTKPGLMNTVLGFGAAMAGGAGDPLNFIPMVNGIKRAKAGAGILSMAGAGQVAKSAGLGFVENAALTAVSDAFVMPQANQWGAGYTFEDVVADVTLGGALGGFLSGAVTAGRVGLRRTAQAHMDGMIKAEADLMAGRPVDVVPVLGDDVVQAIKEQKPESVKLTPKHVYENLAQGGYQGHDLVEGIFRTPSEKLSMLDRELLSEMKERRKAFTDEAVESLNNEPAYAALNDAAARGGISRDSLIAGGYDVETIKALNGKRPGVVSKNSKLGYDELAEMYGYEYGDEFINVLLEAPTKKEYIERYIKEAEDYEYRDFGRHLVENDPFKPVGTDDSQPDFLNEEYRTAEIDQQRVNELDLLDRRADEWETQGTIDEERAAEIASARYEVAAAENNIGAYEEAALCFIEGVGL